MSATRAYTMNPWPSQTPGPEMTEDVSGYGRIGRRRRRRGSVLAGRQIIADQDEVAQAMLQCQFYSGNDVISCFPTNETVIPQHEYATFVWNSRRPELTQINKVDIYLFRADSGEQILHIHDQQNPFGQAGHIRQPVNDSWFGADGLSWQNKNVSYPFSWVIARSDTGLDGSQISQPIFSAVQTTFLDSVASSISAAAASSSASAASLSSLSAASASRAAHPSSSSSSSSSSGGSVQSEGSGSGFPHWAIAVITILGFLAIASLCILAFLIIRRIRRRSHDDLDSGRNSMGSASPMMANAAQQGSPLLATASLPPHPHSPVGTPAPPATAAAPAATSERDRDLPSLVLHDGASATSAGDSGPFSVADAAIMADAFRKMLRKPDFADRLEEGDDAKNGQGDDDNGADDDDDDQDDNPQRGGLIGRELAEEGRDIRSVSSERGVHVETGTIGSDAGSAALGQRRDTL